MSHPRDLALARGALAGDAASLAAFEGRLRFVPRVLVVLNRRLGGEAGGPDLEDVAQDVVTRVWAKLSDYSGQARLETWIYPFCVNVLRNARRKVVRQARGRLDAERVPEPAEEAATPASDHAHVHEALERLGPPGADVVRQRLFEERSFPEIAERMEVPVATAKTWFYRGLESLREMLGGRDEA
ncbi:MAG: RNA polymerase sigma factor [Planctomycetota bacterium JB042]